MSFTNNKYKIKDLDDVKLKRIGFKHNNFSSIDSNTYTYSFPISKYKNHTTLTGIITICPTFELKLDVYDNNVKNYYYPFYHQQSTYKPIIGKIEQEFTRVFKKLKPLGFTKK